MFTKKSSRFIVIASLLIAIAASTAFSQVSTYTFAESAGSYAALGGTNSTAVGDDGTQNGIPIGFSFTYGGTAYTHFCITTNGFIKLGTAATTITGSFGGFSNSMSNTATDRPLIAALWDDDHRNTGAITYSTTGSVGSQVLTVDWNLVNIGGGGSTSGTNFASFQIKLYETTNVVEVIYDATLALAGTLSASVGVNDTTSFLSVTPGAPGTVSSATANNAIAATTDMVGKKYTFTPLPPAPGSLQLSSATYAGNENSLLTATVNRVSGSAGTVGVTYTLADTGATGGAACTAGVDYINPGPQALSFGDLVTSQPINVTLCGDAVTDAGETFTITLSAFTGGASPGSPTAATVTINDTPAPLSGTLTVGSGGNYASLTNTGGLFEALNLSGTSGAITVNIISDLTGETGTVALNSLFGSPSVLIKPSGAPRTISGTNATNAIIRINGADNIRIDGSTAASVVGGNPALREMTVQNLSTATTSGVIALHSNTDGAQNNTLQNLNVLGSGPTQTVVAISIGGATPGTAGADNDGNDVINCSVRAAVFGIYSAGISDLNRNTGTVISQNDLTGTGVNRIRRVGIVVFNDNGLQLTENSVGGIDNTGEGADAVGIGVGAQAISATTVTSTIGVVNALVARNKVSGVSQDATFSAAGIAVAGANGGTNTVVNNMVSGVISDGNAGDLPAGIWVMGMTGSTTRLYNNSVSMTGDRNLLLTPGTSQLPSYALAITGTDPIVEVKNNILYTTQTADLATSPGALSFGMGMATAAFTNLDSNYNDFWSTGANDGGFRTTSLGTSGGVNVVDLPAWRTATGGGATDDFNSIEADPTFSDPLTNLHINTLSAAWNVGVTIASVTNDHDGESRPLDGAYEIGADEVMAVASQTPTFTPTETVTPSNTSTPTFTPTPTPTATCEPLSFNFANPAAVTIPDNGAGSPYPSDIVVSGLAGNVYAVKVKLNGLTHTFPDDIDVLLVGPGGVANAVIMSDVGGSAAVNGLSFTLDSDAATALPDAGPLVAGTFRPTNIGVTPNEVPAPAPAHTGASSLAAFVGGAANGTWSLYVFDDVGGDFGSFAGGWELLIYTDSGPCASPTNTPINSPTSTETATATNTTTPTNTATNTPTPPDTVCDLVEGFDDITNMPGWVQDNNSVAGGTTGWFQGNPTVFPAHTGATNSYIGANFNNTTGTNTISNWLMTAPVQLENGGVITFWTRIPDVGTVFPDRLQVRVSTNGTSTNVGTLPTDVGDFTNLLLDINPTYTTTGYPNAWTQFTVTVSGVPSPVKGRIAFRYFVENGGPTGANSNYIGIDTFEYHCTVATPTATATSTATSTDTPTPTPTSSETPSISGTITYGNAIGNPVPPRFVKTVSVASTVGAPPVGPVITGLPGTYTLTGFGAGAYTITPTKAGGPNTSISSNDAARVAQGVTGAPAFVSNNQRYAADTTGNGGVSSQDAAKIAQFVTGLPFSPPNLTGQWRFFISNLPAFPAGAHPQSRSYASVSGVLTGEDYIGLLIGEASGNWNPAVHPRPAMGPERSTTVVMPRMVTPADNEVIVPISVSNAANKEVISYEFDLRYDPAVIQPQVDPVTVAGTVSRGLSVVANPYEPGLLRVAVYGAYPIEADGLLMNLRFMAVGAPGTVSPLTFERIMFNEGDPGTMVTEGQVELSLSAANQAELTGRLLNSMGQGIPNARVTLTDTAGKAITAMSNGFGTYRFGGLTVGQTYTISVEARGLVFTPLTVSVTSQSVNVDLIAE